MNLNIFQLRNLCKDDTIIMTAHVLNRLMERKISYEDIKNAIMNGEIIEQYQNDFPYPSCLVFGTTLNKKIVHIVVGFTGTEIWIVTAYFPDDEKWESDYKTRKVKN